MLTVQVYRLRALVGTYTEQAPGRFSFTGAPEVQRALEDVAVVIDSKPLVIDSKPLAPNTRAWLYGLAAELRTPYLYTRYFEDGRELTKDELARLIWGTG